MSWQLFLSLSIMMFLQYAIWGAWSPVLAARLLGPLKFSGKQTGWIYGTIPIACIISPLIAGQLVDRWIATEWFLCAAQIIGGVLLLFAAKRQSFKGLFLVMLLLIQTAAVSMSVEPEFYLDHREELMLSPTQVKQFKDIILDLQKDTIMKEAETHITELELQHMIETDIPDFQQISETVRRISTLQGEIRLSRISALLRIRKLLTEEQAARIEELPPRRFKEPH